MKTETEIKNQIILYISRVEEISGEPTMQDWKTYEQHKRNLDEICEGNPKLYELAIKQLVKKMRI